MMQKEFKKFIITTIMLFMVIVLSACDSAKKQDYYSNKENYVNATGTITHIAYDEDKTALYLDFSELSPTFDDTCFKIVGNNLLIVQKNGIDQKIKIGDQIDFITAPKYFGDGYVMPIVSISTNGEYLLEFEEGFTNFLDWLEAK